MVIASEILLGIHQDVADILHKQQNHALHYTWEYILLDIHYGGGFWGNVYHVLLVLGTMWLIMTGVVIYIKIKKRQKRQPNKTL